MDQLPARVGVGAESDQVGVVRGIRFQRQNHVMHVIRANLLEFEQEHPVLQVGSYISDVSIRLVGLA